jgi:hypothetical protein
LLQKLIFIRDSISEPSGQEFHGLLSHSTRANANEELNWRICADFATILIAQARAFYRRESFGVDLAYIAYVFDSTMIEWTGAALLLDGCTNFPRWPHFSSSVPKRGPGVGCLLLHCAMGKPQLYCTLPSGVACFPGCFLRKRCEIKPVRRGFVGAPTMPGTPV